MNNAVILVTMGPNDPYIEYSISFSANEGMTHFLLIIPEGAGNKFALVERCQQFMGDRGIDLGQVYLLFHDYSEEVRYEELVGRCFDLLIDIPNLHRVHILTTSPHEVPLYSMNKVIMGFDCEIFYND